MEPRFLGGRAVIVRSFARIHEANLKKQGVLALTFADPADYDKMAADDTVDITGLADLAPGRNVTVVLHHADGTSEQIETTHTMSPEHIEWFKAGSALNLLRAQQPKGA
jgi:aconitate hydratase